MSVIPYSFHDENPSQYGGGGRGFWSPATSTPNVCEEDYLITKYIAEFINTLSNLAYIYYAVCPPTIYVSHSGTGPPPAYAADTFHGQVDAGRRHRGCDIHTYTLVGVGLCSLLYHASSKAVMCLADEMSMYVLAGGLVYDLYTFESGPSASSTTVANGKVGTTRRQHTKMWTFVLVAVLTTNTAVRTQTGSLDLHSITFAILLVLTGARTLYLIYTWTDPQHDQDIRRKTTVTASPRKRLALSLLQAVCLLGLGFGLWLIDCFYCHQLRDARRRIGLPWAFVLELHGWWHFFTAAAAGEYMALVRALTSSRALSTPN